MEGNLAFPVADVGLGKALFLLTHFSTHIFWSLLCPILIKNCQRVNGGDLYLNCSARRILRNKSGHLQDTSGRRNQIIHYYCNHSWLRRLELVEAFSGPQKLAISVAQSAYTGPGDPCFSSAVPVEAALAKCFGFRAISL